MMGDMSGDARAIVCFTVEVAEDYFLTRLAAAGVAAAAAPGQFVALQVSDRPSPLLRIPLSVGGTDLRGGTFDVVYQRTGPKSTLLSQLGAGASLPCLGPLGNTFPEVPSGRRPLLVGGGIGVPPLVYLGTEWGLQGRSDARLLVGARSAGQHLPEAMLRAAGGVSRATDNGELGYRGTAVDLLREELAKEGEPVVYTCGPRPMLAAVAAMCRDSSIPCFASLEEYMGCGYGVCVGCVTEMAGSAGGGEYARYSRICMDGPVYDAARVAW